MLVKHSRTGFAATTDHSAALVGVIVELITPMIRHRSGTAAATAPLTEISIVEAAPAAAFVSVHLGFVLFFIR